MKKYLKIFAKKFGCFKKVRTFAIPNQTSGGGEMVDPLLEGVVGVSLCEFESRPPH